MKATDVTAGLDLLEAVLDARRAINPNVARGTREFITHLRSSMAHRNTCPYTITSRRYSVWTLVRKYLDEPFTAFIRRYGQATAKPQLDSFRLSEIHKVDPLPIASNHSLPIHESDFDQRFALKQCRITNWQKFLKTLVRRSQALATRASLAGSEEFDQTLDFIQADLLFIIHGLIPSRQRPGRADELSNWNQHTRRAQTFCELCWRPTEYAVHQESSPDDSSGDYKNKRFCHEHNPSDPRSKYRVDHRYKRAFDNELMHLQHLSESEYAVPFLMPAVTTLTAMRKASYDLVHAGLHSPNEGRKQAHSLKEQVYALKAHGMSQADIARELGVSRQAVSKACQKVRQIVARREAAKEVESLNDRFHPEASIASFLTVTLGDERSIAFVTPSNNVPTE